MVPTTNLTTVKLELFPPGVGVINDQAFIISNLAFALVMLMVSIVGVVTNSINIRTFVAMGLDNGMTVTLLGLAVSDLGYTIFGCVLSSANIVNAIEVLHGLENLPIHPKNVIGVFSAHAGYIFYQVTCMTTTYMAIARCMSVAMPFKFKDFFTKPRSVLVLVIFNLTAVATYAPVLSQMGVQRKFDPRVNRTRINLWMSKLRSDIRDVVSTIHFGAVVMVSSFVVAVCILIMAKYLRESVKFRNLSTKGANEKDDVEKSDYKLSGKELQVVQQVIVICVIYWLCMVPTIFYAVYRLVEEEFDVGKKLNNLHFTVMAISTTLQLVNSASTLPVYYVYNSKFRAQLVKSKE